MVVTANTIAACFTVPSRCCRCLTAAARRQRSTSKSAPALRGLRHHRLAGTTSMASVERGLRRRARIWDWWTLPELHRPALHRLRARQRLDRHQRRWCSTTSTPTPTMPPAALPREGGGAGRVSCGPMASSVYLSVALQRARCEIGGLEDRRSARPGGAAPGGRPRRTRSTRLIPDFGGFLVKANTRGPARPAATTAHPRRRRQHAGRGAGAARRRRDVARLRLFRRPTREDRAKQAYTEFEPLDGKFADNVLVQVKNGADRLPAARALPPAVRRACRSTPLMLELQITKEYLGFGTHLALPGHRCTRKCSTPTPSRAARARPWRKVIDGALEGTR